MNLRISARGALSSLPPSTVCRLFLSAPGVPSRGNPSWNAQESCCHLPPQSFSWPVWQVKERGREERAVLPYLCISAAFPVGTLTLTVPFSRFWDKGAVRDTVLSTLNNLCVLWHLSSRHFCIYINRVGLIKTAILSLSG